MYSKYHTLHKDVMYVLLLAHTKLANIQCLASLCRGGYDTVCTYVPLLRKHQASKNSSLTLRKERLFLPMNKDGATNELQTTWAGIPSTRSIDPWSSVFLVPNVYSFHPVHTAYL